jgi:hypothetical protein
MVGVQGFRKRQSWEIWSHYPKIKLENITENIDFSQDSQLPGWESNFVPYRYHYTT